MGCVPVFQINVKVVEYACFSKLTEGGLMIPELKYNEQGLIPAIIQDVNSNEVLMMAFMNKASLEKTVESGRTCFWSRSRQEFWTKGETSGNIQLVREILYDCDEDTLLIRVEQKGSGACHTGSRTCFYRKIETVGKRGSGEAGK